MASIFNSLDEETNYLVRVYVQEARLDPHTDGQTRDLSRRNLVESLNSQFGVEEESLAEQCLVFLGAHPWNTDRDVADFQKWYETELARRR
jgi:hypothetical protein